MVNRVFIKSDKISINGSILLVGDSLNVELASIDYASINQ